MIARAIMAAALVAAALTGGAIAQEMPRGEIRCIVSEANPACGFFAAGPAAFDSARVGPWVVRIYRDSELVWSYGGSAPSTWTIPSQPGDLVEAAIVTSDPLCPPADGVPECHGAGVIVLTEKPAPETE
ncbi:MAG TPA: hypothetical protein VM841_10640 [Actinomycetota bacterium]|nr:hypothetical protein [Actinomycetota bacterium]